MDSRVRGLFLRLFVAGDSPDSAIAIANLEALFANRDSSEARMEIIDVQREPDRAARDGIVVTPTLLKLSPPPACRILGNLKNRGALLQLLGIELPRPDPS